MIIKNSLPVCTGWPTAKALASSQCACLRSAWTLPACGPRVAAASLAPTWHCRKRTCSSWPANSLLLMVNPQWQVSDFGFFGKKKAEEFLAGLSAAGIAADPHCCITAKMRKAWPRMFQMCPPFRPLPAGFEDTSSLKVYTICGGSIRSPNAAWVCMGLVMRHWTWLAGWTTPCHAHLPLSW